MPDRFEAFVEAQNPVFERALSELRAGRKKSHWMWYVYPQLAGLGRSGMSQRFAIASVEEARQYLAHDLLAARLKEAVAATLSHVDGSGRPRYTARRIFGFPDERKFHSSLTLFRLAAPEEELFKRALDAYFGGLNDPATIDLISEETQAGAPHDSQTHI